MTVQCRERLQDTMATYDLLASLFLTLPDEELVRSIVSGAFEEGSGSAALDEIARYGRSQQGRDLDEVLLDLARDRVRLVRGVNQEGIEPPYESMYVKQQANMAIGSLNNFYGQQGYNVADGVKDSPDQIGVEFAFAKLLLEQALQAREAGDGERATELEGVHDSFLSQHLGRWAATYGANMARAAETGFYRGIGLLITEIMP